MADQKTIEILRTGTHTASNGASVTLSEKDLQDIANSYNPANFKAPLIVSHDTKGLQDGSLANSEFAFGFPQALRVVGDRLKAVFSDIAPEFVDWVRQKKLIAVSPSLYLPESPSNPTKGKFHLRHIAALGSSPPAIKGLAPLELQADEDQVLSFSQDYDYESLDFECMCEMNDLGMGCQSVVSIFNGLRDWIIAQKGIEVADQVIPRSAIDSVVMETQMMKNQIEELSEKLQETEENEEDGIEELDISESSPKSSIMGMSQYPYGNYNEVNFMASKLGSLLKEQEMTVDDLASETGLDLDMLKEVIAGNTELSSKDASVVADSLGVDPMEIKSSAKSAKSTKKTKPTKEINMEDQIQDFSEDLAQLREELRLARLETEYAKAQAEAQTEKLKRTELANFCEELVRNGQLLAHQIGDRVVDFGEDEQRFDLVDFMASLDEGQLGFFKDFLESQPSQVSFNEFAPNEDLDSQVVGNFKPTKGYGVSQERSETYAKILDYCEKHKLNPDNSVDFREAAIAVGA